MFAAGSTGIDLHRWATEVEGAVCDAIDSFGTADLKSLPGNDTFSALGTLQQDSLLVDGKPVAEHVLLLLDDVHHLTHRQRSRVLKVVAELRAGVGVWLAERFEALAANEMLSMERLKEETTRAKYNLERFWRDHPRKFETLLISVADRRASAAVNVEISSLDSCLQASLDGAEWADKYEKTIPTIRERVRRPRRGVHCLTLGLKFRNLQAEQLGNVRSAGEL